MKYIFDLHDQSDAHNVLPKLLKLKEILPNLKVNLFTIPNKTSKELLADMKEHDWIQILVHGFDHDDNYECARMTEQEFKNKIFTIPHMWAYEPIFCAPGWQISQEVMLVLKEWKWAVAVQYSDGRLMNDINGPFQPKVFPNAQFYACREVLPPYEAIHGHTWETCGNGLDELWPKLTSLPKDSEFVFIKDYINEQSNQNLSG